MRLIEAQRCEMTCPRSHSVIAMKICKNKFTCFSFNHGFLVVSYLLQVHYLRLQVLVFLSKTIALKTRGKKWVISRLETQGTVGVAA